MIPPKTTVSDSEMTLYKIVPWTIASTRSTATAPLSALSLPMGWGPGTKVICSGSCMTQSIEGLDEEIGRDWKQEGHS